MKEEGVKTVGAPTPLERIILEDIEARTGLSFTRLGSMDTSDKRIADAVLPVLIGWVDKLEDNNLRHAVYSRFFSLQAYKYLVVIISWWAHERNQLALSSLTQTLSLLVRCTDAERVWALCQELPPRPFHYLLVSKLAGCACVEREAKDALVAGLNTEVLRAADLGYIAKVSDPRIQQWFERKVDSSDKYIRAVAMRAVSRRKTLPKGLVYATLPPARTAELFSTEEDLVNVKHLLQQMANEFKLKIPSAIKSGKFLSDLELNKWAVATVSSPDQGSASLWFRLDDIDTVEVALLGEERQASEVH